MQIVYTVSTGYSGSTLLSMLMNAHPQVASIGELSNSIGALLKHSQEQAYDCSCGKDITQCEFWNQVQKQCREYSVDLNLYDFQTQLDLGFGPAVNKAIFGIPSKFQAIQTCRDFILDRVPIYKNTVTKTLDRNITIARAIVEVTGKDMFFDASKNTRIAAKLAERTDIDFKLVHLVRDPRGILNSTLKRNQNATAKFVGQHWLQIHLGALHIKAKLNDKSYLLVNYESLCSNPNDALKRICDFLGIESMDLVESAMKKEHHLIGNHMRKKQLQNISLDEAWRTNLQPPQLTEIKQIAGEVGRTLGYDI